MSIPKDSPVALATAAKVRRLVRIEFAARAMLETEYRAGALGLRTYDPAAIDALRKELGK